MKNKDLSQATLFDMAIKAYDDKLDKNFNANRKWQRKNEIVAQYKKWFINKQDKLKTLKEEFYTKVASSKKEDHPSFSWFYVGSSEGTNHFASILDKYEDLIKLEKQIKDGMELFNSLFGKYPGDIKLSMEGEQELIGEEPQLLIESK